MVGGEGDPPPPGFVARGGCRLFQLARRIVLLQAAHRIPLTGEHQVGIPALPRGFWVRLESASWA